MPQDDDSQDDLFAPIRQTLLNKEDEHKPKKLQPLSSVQRRLLESAAREESRNIIFQHTVLAQTSLPYRNPGDDVRRWERTQGEVHLLVQAGVARHPRDRRWIEQGLPWGTKPRLILAHLNREALLNRPPSPEINVGTSLTAFVERIRGFEHGREIRAFKDQLTRLAAARISLANHYAEDRVCQVEARIVGSFDLWLEKDHRQRVLWPSTVVLSPEYFASLQKHAVPLSEEACAALAHSALALDAYAWLAQRLCRIRPKRKQFITWASLKDQFGFGYRRMIDFKRAFREILAAVRTQYRGAKFELDEHGMTLFYSLPPIPGRHLDIIKDD